MGLKESLIYPIQGSDWFGRIFTLAILQFIPIIGQLLLLGYGLAIVRAVHAGQAGLPSLRWRQALGDGLRLALAGLLYLIPLFVAVPLVFSGGTASDSSGAWLTFAYPLLSLVVLTAVGGVAKRKPRLRPFMPVIGGVLLIGFIVSLGSRLGDLLASFRGGISLDSISLNGFGVLMMLILLLLVLFIFVGLLVVGVRYAVTGQGLLKPTEVARLMISQRRQTAVLLRNLLALLILAALAVSLGAVLLVLPGLFLFVVFSLALWHLLAQYGAAIGVWTDLY